RFPGASKEPPSNSKSVSDPGPLPGSRARRRSSPALRANRRERFAPIKTKSPEGRRCGASGLLNPKSRLLRVHHRLEALQGHHTYLLAGRLCLEHHLLAGEGVDSLARLGRRLLDDLHLQQAGHREEAVALQALLDYAVERVEDTSDLLARQPRVF